MLAFGVTHRSEEEALRAKLDALGRTLETLGPHRVLERGFAIVRDEKGEVLTRVGPARGAAALEVEFADGRVRTRPERAAPGRRREAGRTEEPEQGTLL